MNPGDSSGAMEDPLPLRLVYDDLVRERDRLRDARRSVTSQLGPLPVASAVVVGLFGGLSRDIKGVLLTSLYAIALALFGVIVWYSAKAIEQSPYRTQRDAILPNDGRGLDKESESVWLARMIEMERSVRGPLVDSFEDERKSLILVQRLLVVQVLLLGLIPLIRSLDRLF
jgi:hypothetical protein